MEKEERQEEIIFSRLENRFDKVYLTYCFFFDLYHNNLLTKLNNSFPDNVMMDLSSDSNTGSSPIIHLLALNAVEFVLIKS